MLSIGPLFTTLSLCLVQSQHVSLPRVPRDAKCRTSDLRLIKDYFEKTTIIRNQHTTEPNYCTVMNKYSEDSENTSNSYPLIDLDTVIDLYRTLDYVNSYKYVDSEGPVTQDGFLSINDDELLPLYEIADIRKKHLPCHNSHTGFGEDVDEQMSLMGRRNSDGRGHLLAHSLGGMSRALNVIPMAVNIYWHPHVETSTDLGTPLADWRSNEYWIRRFLLHFYPNGRVVWKMAVQYDENVFVRPKQVRSYRPISFSLQYTAYTDQHDVAGNTLYFKSQLLTFLNDNHYTCKSRVISCHSEDDGQAPPNCDVRMSKKTQLKIHYLGKKTGTYRHVFVFTYFIKGTLYVFFGFRKRNSHETYYAIDNVGMRKDAKVSPLGKNYTYAFSFNTNGINFMYAHCYDDKSWFIRELVPSETDMGQETASGKWPESHFSCAPFTINGKYYFYSQWTNSKWFIRELLPDGKMGEEMSHGEWPHIYPVIFTYVINGKNLLYAHDPTTRKWFVSELLPDGQMGSILNNDTWSVGYHISLKLTENGQQFIYAQTNEEPYSWFLRELLPNGEISRILDTGESDGYCDTAVEFNYCTQYNCTQTIWKYLYMPDEDDELWNIHEILAPE